MKRLLRATIFAAAVLTLLYSASASARNAAQPAPPKQTAVWDAYEITLDAPVETDNPFDPEKENINAVFTIGTQQYTIPAFAYRDFNRELSNGQEKLTPASALKWKIRFTPPVPGDWKVNVEKQNSEGYDFRFSNIYSASFTATPASATASRGFIRVSPDDNRYFQFDDGTPYFAIGENLAWYDARGTYAYDDWLDKLAANGVNYVRLWMPAWAFGLETLKRDPAGKITSQPGNYETSMAAAWQLDYVLEQLKKRGIYAMLCIQNHGPFSYTTNSEWADNPYNAANGGPLTEAADFYTNKTARKLFKQRLRYIIARWGYSTNIMSWELWNEVNLTQYRSAEDVAAWHKEMAAYIKSLDPYKRPVTSSVANSIGTDPISPLLWPIRDIDFIQIHMYASPPLFTFDFDKDVREISLKLARFGKPVLAAEVGVDSRGPAESLKIDPQFLGLHDILWSGVFAETAGTGMPWWWDNLIDPQNQYYQFAAISKFVKDVRFHKEHFKYSAPAASAEGRKLKAHALTGDSTTLVWIRDSRSKWYNNKYKPNSITGATLRLNGEGQGAYRAEFYSTWTGEIVKSIDFDIPKNGTTIAIPEFQNDIALKLSKFAITER